MEQDKIAQPPQAVKKEHLIVAEGGTRNDPYFWMRLSDEQKESEKKDAQTQEVFDYLNAENAYTQIILKPAVALQKKLYSEIVGRIRQKDESVPYLNNGYWYYHRYAEGREYPIYCRKNGSLEAREELLLDVNEMAKGHKYYQVKGLVVSEDNRLLAYGVDTISRREYTIYFKDLVTGNTVDRPIPGTEGEVIWANDNRTVFYSRKDEETLRPDRIFKHRLGTDPATDPLVYHESDETFYTGVEKTKSKKFIVLWSNSTLTNHYQILDADDPDGQFREFSPREPGLEYTIDHAGDSFYIVTNLDAPNFRLMKAPEQHTSRNNWKEVIAHRKDVLLEDVELFKDFLVLYERSEANTLLSVIHTASGRQHYVPFKEEACTVAPGNNHEYDAEWLRYLYTSLATPNSTYDYNMRTGESKLLKQEEVLGYDPANYETARKWATARDGVRVPLSIVYKKGFRKDGTKPALLYGYGSYGLSMDPEFSITRISLLDRGFVYAIAHVRGGQELGRQWYEEGKMFKKKNTFTDFIDCGEYLVKEKFTHPGQLYAQGGSAGGLLMGAVTNMRPDLFHGIIAQVPFVDVVSTMLDESIPLTTGEFDEWGNPKDIESYKYMLSYSPYDNVKEQNYPHMLVTTGLHDSQVQYWEPAKWVAKLRDHKTDNNLLLLRTNMDTGHGGATGRFKVYEEIAEEYAFLLYLAGVKE